ncbi:hypothetical protein BvCmsNSNP030_3361 [Escherichia coli]|nr:hypothetical protein BvCmsNSNP030_1688 [Escherichia coli]BCM48342.1 hypothetical protein BvCmsNSNP030_3361 [Escherichia coli]GCK79116.1 transcriptional regulator PchE [Escherichia coli]GDF05383.1 transcriptional regulator PchE [Escherichia coli]
MDGSLIRISKILVDEFLSTQKRTLEAVEDLIALKLEAAGCWSRASARWLVVVGRPILQMHRGSGFYDDRHIAWHLLAVGVGYRFNEQAEQQKLALP